MGSADFLTYVPAQREQMVAMPPAQCLQRRRTTAAIDVSNGCQQSTRLRDGSSMNTVPQPRICCQTKDCHLSLMSTAIAPRFSGTNGTNHVNVQMVTRTGVT
jgi:hypothetical protein